MAELQQLVFPWRDIELCHATMDTPFNENSRSSQFNIAKAFTIRLNKYNFHIMKSLGGLRYRVKHATSCCQQVAL